MKRDVLRFSGWVGIVLLLAVLVISGCTRSKSSGPAETAVEGEAETVPDQTAETEPTATLTGEEALAATATAWANETATAGAQPPPETAVPETDTPEPTEPAEPTTPAPTETPEPTTPAPGETEEAPEPTETPQPAEATTHEVQAGENLFRIALKYGLTYQELAAHNGIANPNFIMVGQVLKIPAAGETGTPPPAGEASYHTVQPGENVFRIALKYDMLFTTLAAANDLSYPYIIYPGQELVIP